MTLFRPAILLHGVLAVAAFVIALASAAGRESPPPPLVADPAVDARDALEHALAVYRTMRYGEAEDALHCAGFANVAARSPSLVLPGQEPEMVPHPAVKYAADVELPRLGTGTSLCAHLRQAAVQQWYREQFMP
jgi:hypothetical protein